MTESFKLPELPQNDGIWGPNSIPKDLESIPFLGIPNDFNFKIADSFLEDSSDKRPSYRSEVSYGGEDYGASQRGLKKRVSTSQIPYKKDSQVAPEISSDIPRFTKKTSKKTKLEQKSKEKNMFTMKQRPNTRKNDVKIRRMYSKLEASLKVASNWEKIIELEFPFLVKLGAKQEGVKSVDQEAVKLGAKQDAVKSVDLCFSGSVGVLDPSFDRITTKKPLPLKPSNKAYSNQSIIFDHIIQNLSEEKAANVFATDTALTFLMCAPRSTSTWDVQVLKWENVIYLFTQMNPYKTPIDENFNLPIDVPFENVGVNSVQSLYEESFRVQFAFISQIIRQSAGRAHSQDSESEEGFRYKKFIIDNDTSIVVRFQLDAVESLNSGKLDSAQSYSLVRTFLEWRPSLEINWRQMMDAHKSSLIMNSIACNTCSVARWGLAAKLGSFKSVKFGMVSRKNVKSGSEHVVLGTHRLEVDELCGQISLDMRNCWAILKCVLNLFGGYEDGLYHIVKDPNKSSIFLYRRPAEDLATINS